MKTVKFIIPFVVAVFLAAVSARARVESEVPSTRTASCLLRVSCAPEVLPLSYDMISYLLRSSSVSGKAAKDVLGVRFVDDLLKIEQLSWEPGAIRRRVAETLPSDRDGEKMQISPQDFDETERRISFSLRTPDRSHERESRRCA